MKISEKNIQGKGNKYGKSSGERTEFLCSRKRKTKPVRYKCMIQEKNYTDFCEGKVHKLEPYKPRQGVWILFVNIIGSHWKLQQREHHSLLNIFLSVFFLEIPCGEWHIEGRLGGRPLQQPRREMFLDDAVVLDVGTKGFFRVCFRGKVNTTC